jgi:hypothetical protein
MKRMKELEDENRRLKKCTLKNALRLKSTRILLQKVRCSFLLIFSRYMHIMYLVGFNIP